MQARRADEVEWDGQRWCVMICLGGRVEREWSELGASAKVADETLLGASWGGARQMASGN